jgi:hypothetical protein
MLAPPESAQPKEVPRFAAFAAEFMKTYAAANNKPSERAAKACILEHHLLPAFGEMRCDEIRMHAIESMKVRGSSRRSGTLASVLGFVTSDRTCSGIPSVRTSRCAARHRRRSKNSRATPHWR